MQSRLRDFPDAIPISAKNKENLDVLLIGMEKAFNGRMRDMHLLLTHKRMDLVNFFYRKGKIKNIKYKSEGIDVELSLPEALYERIIAEEGVRVIC
jgi:50S ribosomal subunit-associated GTPase HflX